MVARLANEDLPHRRARGMPRRLLALLPAVLAALLYLPTLRFAFVWDDWAFVPAITALDARSVLTRANGIHWLPVWDLSFLLDARVFGADPAGFHATNVVLFVLAVFLVTRLYRQLLAAAPEPQIAAQAGLLALVSALVFAVHPLQVESVSFVAARGCLLALVFALASLLAHARFARRGGWGGYAASLAFTAAALTSKQSAVTLPLLLLLVHLYLRRDVGPWRAALRIAPHAALGVLVAAIHVSVARSAGFVAPIDSPLEIAARIPRALFAAQFYVWKLVWPAGLAIEYDVEGLLRHRWLLGASGVALGAALAAVIAEGWRRRSLAWLCALLYLAALLPVSNLLPSVPLVADRYAQLPLVGLVPLAVVSVLSRLPRRAAALAAALAVAALAVATARQVSVWRDDHTLMARAIAVNPRASAALGNLGLSLWDRGRSEEALRVLEQLHALAPTDFRWAYVKGLQAERAGRLEEAERWLEEAVRGQGEPMYVAHMKLGDVYLRRGRRDDARAAYERALELSASFPVAGAHRYAIQRQLAVLGGPRGSR
jgi:tetratricopeptide (TPR) repeat protein